MATCAKSKNKMRGEPFGGGWRFPDYFLTICLPFPYHFVTMSVPVGTFAKSESKIGGEPFGRRLAAPLPFSYQRLTMSLPFPYNFVTISAPVATCAKRESKM